MSDYVKLKKLDEESLQELQEGSDPVDECICSLFTANEDKKSIFASLKKAFSIKKKKSQHVKDGKGTYCKSDLTTCEKQICDLKNIAQKHSYASIRIHSPDVSTLCPCQSGCLADKLKDNIKVIVERCEVVPELNHRNRKHEENLNIFLT